MAMKVSPSLLLALMVAIAAVLSGAKADIYMHNMRGSNNRLDEANNNRDNANRLFNSQNNNRGGYNVGNMVYYAGSQLMLEWTAQHGSNDPKVNNEIIVQYMCEEQSPGLRDGTTTTTIPDDPEESQRIEYGQHETYLYYQKCKARERNKGLFTADQLGPNAKTAIFTRQNNNGQRYGFECPEERDYYPYWQPTPWIDLAIMTSDMSRCSYYQNNSQNVQSKFECSIPQYNQRTRCIDNGGQWLEVPAHGVPAPICVPACWSRDNHLGNTLNAQMCSLNITIPDTPSKRCVLRMRYNISTADFDWWNVDSNNNTQPAGAYPLYIGNYTSGDGAVLFRNNPQIDIGIGVKLQMNINTNQYPRTFQDRSFVFEIAERPAELKGAYIHNLNVRGKRGNIVQVYPAVEYDFVPNVLVAYKGDYVHIQWTGSNTNDNNNDGQGKAGTDRSNFVQLADGRKNYPMPIENATLFDQDTRKRLALLNAPQNGGETSELDDAGTYFNAGVFKLDKPGVYYYASTRNNNFSNRDQKGVIIVTSSGRDDAHKAYIRNVVLASTLVPAGVVAVSLVVIATFLIAHPPTRRAILSAFRKAKGGSSV